MKKLKKEARCLIYNSMFLGLVFIVLLIVSLVTKIYGLVIGWSIGSLIALVSMFLLFKSGELIEKNATGTGSGGGLVAVFYISRFALYALGLVLCALLFYKLKVKAFQYSLFTCLTALLPTHLFIAIFYHDNVENNNKKADDNKVNEVINNKEDNNK